jgi:transcriptional regulator GlxA family with amidase domain
MNKTISIFVLYLALFISCGSEPKVEKKMEMPDKVHQANTDRYQVGILIMDGVYNTELTAPYDIFQHTQYRKGIKQMDVFMISENGKPVTTFEGMRIMPDYSFEDNPTIDILVVPSAEHHLDTDLENERMISWVKEKATTAEFVTSHCDGAFVLAKTGILDNVASTTFPSDIEKYREMFPNLDVRDSVLFVHDGKFITSAGGAKSFEAALYLCEYLYGDKIARSLAGGLVIDWKLSEVPCVIVEK